jgi:hypothetical protein
MIKTSYDPTADAMFIWLAPEDTVSVDATAEPNAGAPFRA